ncbi:MAG: alginate export family protein, partial [Deltaproteobacteria bacterium]
TDVSGVASIARVKVDANLTDNVDVTFRLLNERAWGTLDTEYERTAAGTATNTSTAVDIDLAYVTFKDMLKDVIGVPLTVKLGRQEIRLGSGLLIGDPDTNRLAQGNFSGGLVSDLSARKSFDAAVAILDLNPLTIVGAAAKGFEGSLVDSKDDVNVFVLDAAYKLGVMDSTLEVAYVLEQRNKRVALHDVGDINVIDGRFTAMPVTDLAVEAEYAYQTQKDTSLRADKDLTSDYAVRLGATYTLANVAMTPAIGLDFTRLTKNWNPMFEDLTPADIANILFTNSNADVYGITLGAKPTKDISAKLRGAYLRAVEVPTGTNAGGATFGGIKKQLGWESDLDLAYDYTSDVQFGLNFGYFKPGKAFIDDNRDAVSQVIGSMKVSF